MLLLLQSCIHKTLTHAARPHQDAFTFPSGVCSDCVLLKPRFSAAVHHVEVKAIWRVITPTKLMQSYPRGVSQCVHVFCYKHYSTSSKLIWVFLGCGLLSHNVGQCARLHKQLYGGEKKDSELMLSSKPRKERNVSSCLADHRRKHCLWFSIFLKYLLARVVTQRGICCMHVCICKSCSI